MNRTARCLSSATTRTESSYRNTISRRAAKKRDELEAKFNQGLDKDGNGNPIRINRENKAVSTPRGSLPISPIMDPEFVEARKRYKQPKEKARVSQIKSRFRKEMLVNPFAHALATPVRQCPVTRANIPNYFHQKLNAVPNPKTGDVWIAPQDMITLGAEELNSVGRSNGPEEEQVTETTVEEEAGETEEAAAGETTKKKKARPGPPPPPHRPVMGSPSAYVLARKPLFQNMAWKKGTAPHSSDYHRIFYARDTFLKAAFGRLIWREDMHLVVLENMRRHVVKDLLYFLRLYDSTGRDYLEPCPSWESIKSMNLPPGGACLLWQPPKTDASKDGSEEDGYSPAVEQFSTFDVRQGDFLKTLPVHDLEHVLGPEYLAVLRKHPLFRDNPLLMLCRKRSLPVQLYLWKLQGYLAQYTHDDAFQVRRQAGKEARQRRREEESQLAGDSS